MAGITSRLSLPYPGNSDPANFASNIQALASRIDAVVPSYVEASTAPSVAHGAFWWCTDNTQPNYGLNYCDGASWHPIGFYVSGTAPSSPSVDEVWLNTSNGSLQWYAGSAWATIISAPTASNQLPVATGSGAWSWAVPSSAQMKAIMANLAVLPNSTTVSNVWSGTNASQVNFTTSWTDTITIASVTGYSTYVILGQGGVGIDGASPHTAQVRFYNSTTAAQVGPTYSQPNLANGFNFGGAAFFVLGIFTTNSPGTSYTFKMQSSASVGTGEVVSGGQMYIIGIN